MINTKQLTKLPSNACAIVFRVRTPCEFSRCRKKNTQSNEPNFKDTLKQLKKWNHTLNSIRRFEKFTRLHTHFEYMQITAVETNSFQNIFCDCSDYYGIIWMCWRDCSLSMSSYIKSEYAYNLLAALIHHTECYSHGCAFQFGFNFIK